VLSRRAGLSATAGLSCVPCADLPIWIFLRYSVLHTRTTRVLTLALDRLSCIKLSASYPECMRLLENSMSILKQCFYPTKQKVKFAFCDENMLFSTFDKL